jgi:hypothetical protein
MGCQTLRIMKTLITYCIALLVLSIVSCAPAPKATSASLPMKPCAQPTSPTAAQRLVQAMDHSEQRLATCSWVEFEQEAKALGITTPPSPEIWQEMLTAALDASWPTQFCLFHWGENFGDSYHEAVYRTFNGRTHNIWVRMACVDWEIKKARAEPWVAESVLRFTQRVLEADPEPYPSPNGDIKGYTAEGGWITLTLPSIWYVPTDAEQSRADMLAWVKRALANRAQWYYSERKRWVAPSAQPPLISPNGLSKP